jgi:RPA family protein
MSSKLFITSLLTQLTVKEGSVFLGEKRLGYVWIQGIITFKDSESNEIIVDDGTASITVLVSPNDFKMRDIMEGDYVMVNGRILIGETDDETQVVVVDSRMVSLIQDPNFEILWTIEVMEGYSSLL